VSGLDRLANGRRLVYPVVGLMVVVLSFITFTRAGAWSNEITLNMFTLKNHPESYRALIGSARSGLVNGGDVVDIFASFARAASAREATIVPLAEMHKIAVGIRATLDPAPASGSVGSPPPGVTDPLGAPLVLTDAHMAGVGSALDDEMARRLTAYPVGAESVYTPDRLSECVLEMAPMCQPLAGKLEHWYQIALDNQRVSPEDRAFLYMSRGHFLAARGDAEGAVASMGEAVRIEPGTLGYPLSLAALHMQLQQWDEAGEILTGLESRRSWSGFGDRQLRRLRARYDDHMRVSRVDLR